MDWYGHGHGHGHGRTYGHTHIHTHTDTHTRARAHTYIHTHIHTQTHTHTHTRARARTHTRTEAHMHEGIQVTMLRQLSVSGSGTCHARPTMHARPLYRSWTLPWSYHSHHKRFVPLLSGSVTAPKLAWKPSRSLTKRGLTFTFQHSKRGLHAVPSDAGPMCKETYANLILDDVSARKISQGTYPYRVHMPNK